MLAGGLAVVTLGAGRADRTGDGPDPPSTTTTARPLTRRAADHQIAYLSTDGAATTIFLTDGTGASTRVLARLPGRAERLAWSPDGARLLLDGDAAGDFELQVVDATSGAAFALAPSPASNEGGASWSPDGTRVAFFSDRDGDFAGYVVDSAGGEPTRITPPGLGAVTDLAWSPDGRSMAFATSAGVDGEVWIVAADGTGARRVTELAGATQPAWSPDGRALAISAQPVGASSADIHVVDVESGDDERVASTEHRDGFPVWAPDGASVYFVAEVPNDDADGGAADDILRVDLDGGGPVAVTADPISIESELAVTPDGELVAFSVTRLGDKEVFVANGDGTGAIPVSRSERLDAFAAWRPGTGPG